MNSIKIKSLGSSEFCLPTQGSSSAAGWDLRVIQKQIFYPRDICKVPLGFATELPKDTYAMLTMRSGLASKGLTLVNAPGIIDADYRGEWTLLIYNIGVTAIVLIPGDRIAQAILHEVLPGRWEPGFRLPRTKRDKGGFGSTGNK